MEIHLAVLNRLYLLLFFNETSRNFVIMFSYMNYSSDMNLKPKNRIFQEILSCFNPEMVFYLTTSSSPFLPFQITL